jgi:hypothetical protein
MFSVLASNLTAQSNNPMNAMFEDGLKEMLKECRSRLQLLLGNEFLVLSSLLDPCFTIQTEALMGKQFRDYFAKFAALIKSYQNDGLVAEPSQADTDATELNDDNLQSFNFWESYSQQTSYSSQSTSQRAFEDQLEVTLQYFTHFNVITSRLN